MKAQHLITTFIFICFCALCADYWELRSRVNSLEARAETNADALINTQKATISLQTSQTVILKDAVSTNHLLTALAHEVVSLDTQMAAHRALDHGTPPATAKKTGATLTRTSYDLRSIAPTDDDGNRRTYDIREARNLGFRYQMLGAICHQGAWDPNNADRAEELERASNYYFGAAAAFLWMAEERGEP